MANPIPVIVGVGEFKNASRRVEDALEPLDLMMRAIEAAAQDAAGDQPDHKLLGQIDSVSVVASSTWNYNDLPGLVADKLGVHPSHAAYSKTSGSSPVQLVDDATRLVAQGHAKLALAVGGEAKASLKAFVKAGQYPPPWTPTSNSDRIHYANNTDKLQGMGKVHQVGVPMQVYAMYENALRSHRQQSQRDNLRESAELYGQYAQIAAQHPMAWSRGQEQPENADTIGTITKRNRMICHPYPLLMNAFNDVNLSAACLITSTEFAERLNIPREKWIFPLGGGRAEDPHDIWDRPNFHSSPAIATALDMCLKSSRLKGDDMDLFDFYSCFPVVPKLACRHLGIPYKDPPVPITLLGGLTSFGGAGANYSMHAVAEMVRQLRGMRNRPWGARGLILANGGTLTWENAICLSTQRRRRGTYPLTDTPASSVPKEASPPVDKQAIGEAVIETYTVEYDRENQPRLGHVVCRLMKDGHRIVANHGDGKTLEQLATWDKEPIGQTGMVWSSPDVAGQNLFSFPAGSRL